MSIFGVKDPVLADGGPSTRTVSDARDPQMSSALYAELQWLPPPPPDFKQQCKAIADTSESPGLALRELAGYGLDENQLTRLGRLLGRLRSAERDLTPLSPFKLGVISNSTTSFLIPAILASAVRFGVLVDCVAADYDQVLQNALDPASAINAACCDAVLIAVDFRGLPLGGVALGDPEAAEAQVTAALDYIKSIRAGIRASSGAISIVQTLARPPETLFGSLDRVVPGSLTRLIEAFNRRLADSLENGDVLLDVAGLAETVGLANWHDPTLWNLAKVPFSNKFLPLYGDHVGRLIGALRGKSRRTLILDLDNTVWSGVIGDDGVEGIVIGQGDPTGEAHLALQAGALALRDRGVVLAVSSKNDDDVARMPFRTHPDMLLRENHIAVFQANWNDKATNIMAIAKALSLGLDAMTFVDDNPFERNFVRQSLPGVAVPELPTDPALYHRTLSAAGYFEAVAFSTEDRQRADFYQDNAKRAQLQTQAGDLEEYLRSLDMEITLKPFDAVGRSRIAQLINKSNQFNLTTKRYTEADVESAENDPDTFTLQVRLRDRLGDNGMISVIICRQNGDDWDIDTWLMSCRVLGRRVEQAVLRELLLKARDRGVHRLIGRYLPTDRNTMVRDHYRNLGFDLVEEQTGGGTVWALDARTTLSMPIPMAVDRGS
jgi:FkbH-like protein